jgi:hypothetical protein
VQKLYNAEQAVYLFAVILLTEDSNQNQTLSAGRRRRSKRVQIAVRESTVEPYDNIQDSYVLSQYDLLWCNY